MNRQEWAKLGWRPIELIVLFLVSGEIHSVTKLWVCRPLVQSLEEKVLWCSLISEAKHHWHLNGKLAWKTLQKEAMANHVCFSLGLKAPCRIHHELVVTLWHLCSYVVQSLASLVAKTSGSKDGTVTAGKSKPYKARW